MKKFLAQVSGALAATQFAVGSAFAQLPNPDTIPGLPDEGSVSDIKTLIIRVISIILDFVLLIAVVFVIVAGIRLIVSGGDEAQKDKAKQTIIYVIIGIIVVLFARVIVTLVNSLFTS
ncbi:MAG: TrbC/VirB2 family protein [Candidatus Peribacteraceae bacterium]|nr:TrbC/VirB2 family protein [Candidatus Peribacteraceae bacterium]